MSSVTTAAEGRHYHPHFPNPKTREMWRYRSENICIKIVKRTYRNRLGENVFHVL